MLTVFNWRLTSRLRSVTEAGTPAAVIEQTPDETAGAVVPIGGYAIGDPGRASVEVGAGVPCGPLGWPDTAIDAHGVGGLEVRAASVRGIVHRYYGTPRQDSYSIAWQQDSNDLIIVVCDGVGSLESSHEAADLVARRMAAVLTRDADTGELGWAEAFTAISDEIVNLSTETGGEMATTVVCACISAAAECAHRADIAWIGDSAAYLLTASGWAVVGGSVKTAEADGDAGAPLSSSTKALPSSSIALHTNAIEFTAGAGLFLMTDGVADALGTGCGEVGEGLGLWWDLPPDKFTFAAQVGSPGGGSMTTARSSVSGARIARRRCDGRFRRGIALGSDGEARCRRFRDGVPVVVVCVARVRRSGL
jgi:hypothetical protein